MNRKRPTCPVYVGPMIKNGTTTKGTTSWRCNHPECSTRLSVASLILTLGHEDGRPVA
ncbi:hypothetical protein SFC07_10240 [Corynebacterium callunae]|uniref:hypothetical protein n=1 Tax=Corynebacterium callunae TaxID=1721 RepID=UPI003981BE8C